MYLHPAQARPRSIPCPVGCLVCLPGFTETVRCQAQTTETWQGLIVPLPPHPKLQGTGHIQQPTPDHSTLQVLPRRSRQDGRRGCRDRGGKWKDRVPRGDLPELSESGECYRRGQREEELLWNVPGTVGQGRMERQHRNFALGREGATEGCWLLAHLVPGLPLLQADCGSGGDSSLGGQGAWPSRGKEQWGTR